MNIGFYGDSFVEDKNFAHISEVVKHFDANIVHLGTTCCSEERTLFELKKTKKLDLAVIFHSKPHYMFVPSWSRDIRTFGYAPKVLKKLDNTWMIVDKSDDNLDHDFDAVELWYRDELEGENRPIDRQEFVRAMGLMKKYLFHPDLQLNRYYGALTQIDKYLVSKNISVVHCVGEKHWYPSWFKFRSGITDESYIHSVKADHFIGYKNSPNVLNAEGNFKVISKLIELINAASSRAGSTLDVQSRDGGSSPPAAP